MRNDMSARVSLLLLACVCVRGSLLTKEYICKDPDTGTLHPVNSTWRSTSFCGNYTCKLRLVNKGSEASPPTSKIIVNLTGPQARVHSKEESTIDLTSQFSLSSILPELGKDNDRLLNPAEINKITELLHTVKKSDLQAVIELYNVAQEIYKGMKIGTDDIKNPDGTDYDSREFNFGDINRPINNKVSYWYEPVNGYRKEGDMKHEGSEYKPTVAYPVRRQNEVPYYYVPRNSNYPSYFSGTLLSNNDFGRLGYYNPQASYQSLPAYYQQRQIQEVPGATQNTPCSHSLCAMHQYQTTMPVNPGPRANYPSQTPANNMMQPYPSSLYNYSSHAYNNYYKGNPWAYYDYYRNLPYQAAAQIPSRPIVVNAEAIPNVADASKKTEDTKKEDDKSWKTDSLSEAVINEIRANVAERAKLLNIPLKKRIKLERAAKVIKLDQFNNRKTRSVTVPKVDVKETVAEFGENNEINNSYRKSQVMETYLEKMTCQTTTELGFFRIGNMTRPFPECCPEKIDDKDSTMILNHTVV